MIISTLWDHDKHDALLTRLLAVVAETLGRGAHLGVVADVAALVAGTA